MPTKNKPASKQALKKFGNFFRVKNKNGLKYGSVAVVWTVIFIAAVMVVNVLISFLTDRFALRLDMTSDHRYAISSDTKKLIKSLDEPVELYVFASESDYRSQTYGYELAETLYRYVAYSDGNISLEFIDPLKNPDFVNKYKTSVDISKYAIVAAKGEKFTSISQADQYWWYDSDHSYAVGTSVERRLTIAIANLSADELPVAAVCTGKDEIISQELVNLLNDNSYTLVAFDPATDDIPEGTELLIISAPQFDFTDYEIEKIENYLLSYKDAIISLSYDGPVLPNFELFLREWGVEYGNSVVLDAKYRAEGEYFAVATYPVSGNEDYAAYVEGLGSSQYVIMPYSRPIKSVWMGNNSGLRYVIPLMQTSAVSYAKPKAGEAGGTLSILEKADGDENGPFYSAVLVNSSQVVEKKTVETNILFLSSPYLFDSGLVNTESYGNMRFVNNVLGKLNPVSSGLTIQNKTFAEPELAVIGNSLSVILFFLIVIPALCLFMGFFVWYRRKNR